jgi:hypothetical protein
VDPAPEMMYYILECWALDKIHKTCKNKYNTALSELFRIGISSVFKLEVEGACIKIYIFSRKHTQYLMREMAV